MKTNKMRNLARIILILSLLFFCIGCDQTTKMLAKAYLSPNQPIIFLNDIFRIQYIENTGAFLGLGNAFSAAIRFWVLTVFVFVFLLAGLAYIFFNKNLEIRYLITYTIIIAGGASNLADRILNNGRVVDFLNVGIGNLRTGIFNVADMFITFGTLYLMYLLSQNKGQRWGSTP